MLLYDGTKSNPICTTASVRQNHYRTKCDRFGWFDSPLGNNNLKLY